MGRRLRAGPVIETLERLQARIAERFPDAGLTKVCADLTDTARKLERRARQASRPYLLLRAGVLAVIVAAVAGPLTVSLWAPGLHPFERLRIGDDAMTLAQGLEAAANLLILAGAAVWFLIGLEQRLKRRRALSDLYQLRAFAHVVDMHQLTKDPTVVLGGGAPTASSPRRAMTQFQLTRYLEYCAEMQALIGKLAAFYAEDVRDDRVIETVAAVEALTADLGRKIWQKITILSALDESRAG